MRIAVIGPTYPFRGGIAHYTTLMVKSLRQHHQVLFLSYLKQYPKFIFPGRTQIDSSSDHIETENVKLFSFADPTSWWRVARVAVLFQPEIVLFSWVSPALAVQFRYMSGYIKRRCPKVRIAFLCHNVIQHEERSLDRFLTILGFRNVDHFIVHNRESEQKLLTLKPEATATVTDHPIYDVFNTGPVSGTEAREKLGLSPSNPVALYFGFVRQYKGLIYLLRALPLILEKIPSFHLIVAGEFWEDRSIYDKEVSKTDTWKNVTIEDRYIPNEEVPFYFNAADLVVLPYVSATASGIIQIAYGFGKPVVTTAVGGLPDVVEPGLTGYLVPPADPAGLAEAVSDFFLFGDGEEYRKNIENYRSRFSWNQLVSAIEGIVQDDSS